MTLSAKMPVSLSANGISCGAGPDGAPDGSFNALAVHAGTHMSVNLFGALVRLGSAG